MCIRDSLYPVAIEAVSKKEEDKLGTFLARAAEADPTIRITRDEDTHQTIIHAIDVYKRQVCSCPRSTTPMPMPP